MVSFVFGHHDIWTSWQNVGTWNKVKGEEEKENK